jgi:hypothetical protein
MFTVYIEVNSNIALHVFVIRSKLSQIRGQKDVIYGACLRTRCVDNWDETRVVRVVTWLPLH